MRAAVCREFGQPFLLEEVELSPPGPDEIQVRLRATSICHSDIIFADGGWGGKLPAIYGHEGAGVVEAVGADVDDVRANDHVVLTMVRSCGSCPCCSQGLRGCCEQAFAEDERIRITDRTGRPIVQGLKTAAFAERAVVHRSQVVPIANDLPFDVAALLACGVITGFGAVANSAAMRAGANVVVIGAGGVGLNCIQAATIQGAAQVIAIDPSPSRREAALAFGANTGVDSQADEAVAAIFDLTRGRGADYVFVAAGIGAAIDLSYRLLVPGGMAVLVGIPQTGVLSTIDPGELVGGSRRIVGSKLGDADIRRDIPMLIDLYREGRLKLDELITDRFAFDDVNRAISTAKRGEGLKTVIEFEPATGR